MDPVPGPAAAVLGTAKASVQLMAALLGHITARRVKRTHESKAFQQTWGERPNAAACRVCTQKSTKAHTDCTGPAVSTSSSAAAGAGAAFFFVANKSSTKDFALVGFTLAAAGPACAASFELPSRLALDFFFGLMGASEAVDGSLRLSFMYAATEMSLLVQ